MPTSEEVDFNNCCTALKIIAQERNVNLLVAAGLCLDGATEEEMMQMARFPNDHKTARRLIYKKMLG